MGILATVGVTGCCGNLVVSQRYHEPTCEAEAVHYHGVTSDILVGGMPRPGWPEGWRRPIWPEGLRAGRLQARCDAWREDFADMLQPEPPPLKPPHPRFHPLPTQPVFAQRAGYAPPELISAKRPAGPPRHASPVPFPEGVEAIPAPLPESAEDALAPPVPPRPLAPFPSAEPDPRREFVPVPLPPPVAPPPSESDASRGAIAPSAHAEALAPPPAPSTVPEIRWR